VHDVGDLVGPRDFIGGASHKHPVSNGGNNDGDVLRNLGRIIPHLGIARKQSNNMCMSSIDNAKRWCLESARHVSSVHDIMTSKLPTKLIHPSIPPAPDPVKLDPNLSPLGGEKISTIVSKISSNLNCDVVDRDPTVERSSDTVD
jgi:hypothetical protein